MPVSDEELAAEQVYLLLQQQPEFQNASPEEQDAMFDEAMAKLLTPLQPPSPSIAPFGRELTPGMAARIGTEAAGAAGGAFAAGKLLSPAISAIPHPGLRAAATAATALGGAALGAGTASAAGAAVSRAVGSPDVPPGQAFGEGAIGGAIGEGVGRIMTGAARMLGKPILGSPLKYREEAEFAEQQLGTTLSPAMVAEHGALPQAVAQILRATHVGREKFLALEQQQKEALTKYADRWIAERLGGTKTDEQLGTTLQTLVRDARAEASRISNELYTVLDEIGPVKTTISGQLLREFQTLKSRLNPTLHPKAQAIVDLAISKVASFNPKTRQWIPKNVSFRDLHETRSYLYDLRYAGDLTRLPSLADKEASVIAKRLTQTMEDHAAEQGLLEKLKIADQWQRTMHDVLESRAIRQILRSDAERIVDLSTGPGRLTYVTQVKRMIQLLPESERESAEQIFKQATMRSILKRATENGVLAPDRLYDAVYGRNGVGEAVFQRVFGPEMAKEFSLFVKTAGRMGFGEKKTPWVSKSAVMFMENGIFIFGPMKHAANTVAYFLGGHHLAKVMTSKEGLRLLRQGSLMSPSSQRAATIVSRLAGIAFSEAGGVPEWQIRDEQTP